MIVRYLNAEALIDQLGGWNHDQTYQHLSGGERQRLHLLRAFSALRPVIILDEPEAHLDRVTIRSLVDLIEIYRGEYTLLIITHDAMIHQACTHTLSLS